MINIFMAIIKVQVAGAPFDPGNIFTTPAIDAGNIVNPFEFSIVDTIDGGDFSQRGPLIVDGGYIPLAGTATYDPEKEYGPGDIVELEFEIPDY